MKVRILSLFLFLLLLTALPGCAAVITDSESGPGDPVTEPVTVEETAVAPTSTPLPTETAAAPTSTPLPAETAVPEATAEPVNTATAFCPEVPRPALILAVPMQGYVVFDPDSGSSCEVVLPASEATMLQPGGEEFFYLATEGAERLVVHRLQPDGTDEALPATTVSRQEGYRDLSFTVSDDGTMIAWAVYGPDAEQAMFLSDLFVAPVSSAEDTPVTALVSNSMPQRPEVLHPLRFSADNSVLYYTLLPQGIGGSWLAFSGRYQNLYAVPTAGGEPELIFSCDPMELGLCLGDFQVHENEVLALAYTDWKEGTVVVTNGEGQELNRFTPEGEYVGYPTLSPGGELLFYSATLAETDGTPLPSMGTLHRVAPPSAPAEVLAAAPELLLPQRFLDDSRVVIGYVFDEMNWGLALVDMMGEIRPIEEYPNAALAGVLK